MFYVLGLCLCLFPCAFLLLMLVSAGLNSVIERTLLAWWQLRQAPTFSPVFGLSTFLMDGAKLFAKASCMLEFRLGYGFILCAALFASSYFAVVFCFAHVGLLFCSSISLGSVFSCLLGLLNPNALLLIFGIFAFTLSFVGRVVLPRILICVALEGTIPRLHWH